MSILSKPYTFSPNTTASSSEVNANFDTLYNDYNGGISAANLADNAVTTAKITDLNVTTAKLADDSVTPAKLDSDAIGHGFLELGRTTLGSAGDTISVANIPARKHLKIRIYVIDTGGTVSCLLRFNNDTSGNYAVRVSTGGGADVTPTGETSITLTPATAANPVFAEINVINVAAQEKLVVGDVVARGTAGAANAPTRREVTGKWANTSDQITRVDVVNGGTGDFAIGSEVVVLGHD